MHRTAPNDFSQCVHSLHILRYSLRFTMTVMLYVKAVQDWQCKCLFVAQSNVWGSSCGKRQNIKGLGGRGIVDVLPYPSYCPVPVSWSLRAEEVRKYEGKGRLVPVLWYAMPVKIPVPIISVARTLRTSVACEVTDKCFCTDSIC
jgi:hypothetical protein